MPAPAFVLTLVGFVLIVVGVVAFVRRRDRRSFDVPALVTVAVGGLLAVVASIVTASLR